VAEFDRRVSFLSFICLFILLILYNKKKITAFVEMFHHGFLLLICLVATETYANIDKIGIKISHSTALERIDNTIIYQSSLPLAFQSPMPDIHLLETIDSHVKCTSGPDTDNFCKASQIIQELDAEALKQIKSVSDEIRLHEMFIDNGTHSVVKRNILDPLRAMIGEVAAWCCGVSTERDFKSLFARQEDIDTAIVRMSNNLNTNHRKYTSISKEFSNMAGTMNKNFKSFEDGLIKFKRHFEDVTSESSLWHQFLIRTITHLFVRNYENSRHWKRSAIITDCRNNFIPAAIVNQDALFLQLTEINAKLALKGWTLAIPIQHISHYYTQRLSECLISNKNILVKIKIPIKEISPTFTLFKFRTVPQKFENSTCELMLSETYLAVSEDESTAVPIMGETLRTCEINAKHGINMCLLPKRPQRFALGTTCPELIFRGAPIQQLIGTCGYKCYPSNMPLITALNYDTFVITHPHKSITFVCGDNKTKLHNENYDAAGSLEIRLPCTCKLYMGEKLVIDEEFPCNNANDYISAAHILPALWSKMSHLRVDIHKQHMPTFLFTSFNDSFNPDWKQYVPHLDIDPPKLLPLWDESITNATIFQTTPKILPSNGSGIDWLHYVYGSIFLLGLFAFISILRRRMITIIRPTFASHISNDN